MQNKFTRQLQNGKGEKRKKQQQQQNEEQMAAKKGKNVDFIMWYENCCRSVKMSIYIVMHHAHTGQREGERERERRGNKKRLDLRTRVEKLKYLPIYSIYTYKSS